MLSLESRMPRNKRKLSTAEKARNQEQREKFLTVSVNGKQKRVQRPPTIDGMDVDEFIRRNADPIWLQQNEMWEFINSESENDAGSDANNDIPF